MLIWKDLIRYRSENNFVGPPILCRELKLEHQNFLYHCLSCLRLLIISIGQLIKHNNFYERRLRKGPHNFNETLAGYRVCSPEHHYTPI